jgi:ADP-heptose:LPS heptosyltransferase
VRKLLLRFVYHLCRALRPKVNSAAQTFLILQYRIPLGCCVHGTPIYTALKAAHPDCRIIVATYGLGHQVLAHNPLIDHLIDTGAPPDTAQGLLSFASALRNSVQASGLRPTQILQDASNRRGTLALLALLLRLAPTAGFADLPEIYDEHLDYDPTRSLIANNLRLVGPETAHVEPSVYFTARDLDAANTLFRQANPGSRPVTAFIVQGSGAQPNSWHDDRFAAVIQHVESLGHCTVFLGTSAEAPDIDRVRAAAQSTGTSLAGNTSVTTLAAVLALCNYVISVDTGSMHVSRAVGTPMVVLGPSWQPAIEWLPIDLPTATVLRGPDKFLPRHAIRPDYRLDEITAPDVIEAFEVLTQRYPPAAEERQQRINRLLVP